MLLVEVNIKSIFDIHKDEKGIEFYRTIWRKNSYHIPRTIKTSLQIKSQAEISDL